MSQMPHRWTTSELAQDAALSANVFRSDRWSHSDAWATRYKAAHEKFSLLFEKLGDLGSGALTNAQLAEAYDARLGEALRYLAGPPVSDDDLRVIADVESLAPGMLKKRPGELRKVYEVIERIIDPFRFPWMANGGSPTEQQRQTALTASPVVLATQRLATERRHDGKEGQETRVKDYLREMGFVEVPTTAIHTLVKGPQAMQFCAECQLDYQSSGVKQREVGEFMYAAQSWARQRRVITRREYGGQGTNPRYVVTNLPGDAQALYDDLYCQRGEAENRIKEAQVGLFATRTSCQHLQGNQLRVLLAALGYVLIERLRALALRGTALANAQVDTLRIKLLKLAAVVTRNTRRIRLYFASNWPSADLFAHAMRQLRSA